MRKRIQISANLDNPDHVRFLKLTEEKKNRSDFIIQAVLKSEDMDRPVTRAELEEILQNFKENLVVSSLSAEKTEKAEKIKDDIDEMMDNW